jgi:hypothetical protein
MELLAFSIGITAEQFKHLTPLKLDMCFEGFRISRERQDSDVWNWFGAYGISALCFAIDHCFNGKKAKMEYWKEPLFSNKTENDSEMSEEEIQRQREAFVMKMRTMKVNFDLSHQETTGGN